MSEPAAVSAKLVTGEPVVRDQQAAAAEGVQVTAGRDGIHDPVQLAAAAGVASTQAKSVEGVPTDRGAASGTTTSSVPEVHQPTVTLTAQDQESCVVGVGDLFPDLKLQRLDGQAQDLAALIGEKLTVVVFWSNQNRMGQEQIQRLPHEIIKPFEADGVQVIAINVGDAPDVIAEIVPSAYGEVLASLRDPDGAAFAEVAKGRLPRSYLLDAKGRILWFDIEYSRHTRRELANAIRFFLNGGQVGDS